MRKLGLRASVWLGLALSVALTASTAGTVFAQSAPRNGNQPSAADPSKDTTARKENVAEVARVLTGPAANPECVWVGQRAVNRLLRDDLDTAFRHLDLYDRFGCPGGHIQMTFRCLVRLGDIVPKNADPANKPETPKSDTVEARIQACWINPESPVLPTASAPTEQATGQAR